MGRGADGSWLQATAESRGKTIGGPSIVVPIQNGQKNSTGRHGCKNNGEIIFRVPELMPHCQVLPTLATPLRREHWPSCPSAARSSACARPSSPEPGTLGCSTAPHSPRRKRACVPRMLTAALPETPLSQHRRSGCFRCYPRLAPAPLIARATPLSHRCPRSPCIACSPSPAA